MIPEPTLTTVALRQTQGWLLMTQQMLVIHLIGMVPNWALAIVNLSLLWSLAIFLGKVRRPPTWLLFTLTLTVLLALIPIYLQQGIAVTLGIMIALSYCLKSLEVRSRRDILTLVLVGFFLITLSLIEQQSWLKLMSALALFILNATILLSLHRPMSAPHNLRMSLKLVLGSLPMAVILYLLLPRLEPLWQQPVGGRASTGLSAELALGEIALLTQSNEPAFSARFTRPPQDRDLYWRVWIQSHFDGQVWRAQPTLPRRSPNHEQGDSHHGYQLLGWPQTELRIPSLAGSHSRDASLGQISGDLWQRLYQSGSPQLTFRWQPGLAPTPAKAGLDYLQLPEHTNPRTLAWGQRLRSEGLAPRAVLQRLLIYFQQQPFVYTLRPPATGRHQVDDFLFTTQAGFCGHYASATVTLLRAAGIPARLISGYQGGRWLPDGRLMVRQLNAHAWVEFWVEGAGWLRSDPTQQVSPDRIEQLGQQRLFQALSWPTWLQNPALTDSMNALLDRLDYQWQRSVLEFDKQQQRQWLAELLAHSGSHHILLLTAAVLATLALIQLGLAGMLPRWRPPAWELLLWRQLRHLLTRRGLRVTANASMTSIIHDAAIRWPGAAADLGAFQRRFEQLRYNPNPAGVPRGRRLLWHRLLRIRRHLARAAADERR
ncbi:DUF3488 and transglutaminase-like domain-containing protein [Ferrimonas sp. SCSIO 43195]|uniref:transglutaminase family protein n=1 Tax=Ferrimonas sp. SCSIO 43195 TaxID=2822844 RepID=UPI0020762DC9|nr:DUF3488 and transglutaminase-like domain-containing protein [Ferrimonas sp. SCSIO 43195]USD38821.1 DUF3488 domain-containing transglutaminase family protein [Ferrimonas sp. SCSIO 43195]